MEGGVAPCPILISSVGVLPHVSCLKSFWGPMSRAGFSGRIIFLWLSVWLFLSILADSDAMPRIERLCAAIGASNRTKSRLRSLEGVFGAFMIRVALGEAVVIL